MEVEGGKVQGNIPPGASTLSQGLLVEVDDKEVTINRRDFHTNSWTGEPWKIKLPAKKDTFTHIEDRDKEKPYFAKDAKLAVSNVTEKAATVTFPQALDNLLVHSYRVQARDKQTGEIKNKLLAKSLKIALGHGFLDANANVPIYRPFVYVNFNTLTK
ncbi:Purple acid phosphatase/fibronectin domain protein [Bacillus cereus]|nr:Purple acid phosphatase/fibronectin domain protein [Bacillus cereus]